MKMIDQEWLNNFNKTDKNLKIWNVVYVFLLAYAFCLRRLEMTRLVKQT
jgi:hypothetical protein